MNVIDITELKPETRLVSFQDTAMFLNLFCPEVVEELLEVFTDFTDFDLIAELVDILNLKITCVTEAMNHGTLIHGYIHDGDVLA
ncbi:MAG: hypothetical protein IJI42_04855 [Methanobrevibacter sp.]|nr:hypothetical protein [Methanobrevibacter sp.]